MSDLKSKLDLVMVSDMFDETMKRIKTTVSAMCSQSEDIFPQDIPATEFTSHITLTATYCMKMKSTEIYMYYKIRQYMRNKFHNPDWNEVPT